MNRFPVRKSIRCTNYDYDSSGAYFITICTVNKMCILSEIVGGGDLDAPKNILSEYGETVKKNIILSDMIKNINVDNYVIMPNHIHILLRIENNNINSGTSRSPSPTNKALPRYVSALKRFINRDIGYNIFQRSYHDRIIRNEQEYLEIWEYIKNNPINWQNDSLFADK